MNRFSRAAIQQDRTRVDVFVPTPFLAQTLSAPYIFPHCKTG
jgi:hypothetical protein